MEGKQPAEGGLEGQFKFRLALPSNSTPNDGAYRRFSAHLQPPARSDFEAPIRLAGQEGAVQIASVEKFIRSS